jgi:hypothetical protein
MSAWLVGDRVILPDGNVRSWDNPAHPGYGYPEITGLLLSLLSHEGPAPGATRDNLARALTRGVSPTGSLGRAGIGYAFDTAMGLGGLLEYRRSGGRLVPEATIRRMFGFIERSLLARRAAEPDGGLPGDRWSVRYGCHLLKVARALDASRAIVGDDRPRRLVDQLADDLIPLGRDGRFVTDAGSDRTYLHAHCYAVEGLLCLARLGRSGVAAAIRRAAEWLRSVQDESGALLAWHDGASAWGEPHADAIAQAVRIWTIVDRDGFAGPIARSLDFLAGLQAVDGGIHYRPGSGDVNSWSTIFAVQAARWARAGAEEHRLI